MRLTEQNLGWQIRNGSGWNHHETAATLETMLHADKLPAVPIGYGVLVAPISDKPLGLRIALVKVLPRKTGEVDGEILDDGPDGEPWQWAWNAFHVEVERIDAVTEDQQKNDNGTWAARKMAAAIKALPQ